MIVYPFAVSVDSGYRVSCAEELELVERRFAHRLEQVGPLYPQAPKPFFSIDFAKRLPHMAFRGTTNPAPRA